MADNPRRLAIKKLSPDMFRVVDNISIEGLFPDQPTEKAEFSSIGNRFLLDRVEFFQVQCSRNDFLYSRKNGETYRKQKPLIETKQYLSQKCAMLEAGHKGAVIVSPCISDGEKALARIASEMGFPIITLCRTGFERLYKPSGELYDLCASGKLLMLAPIAWGVQYGKRTITREKAVILNRLVQLICKNKGSEIEYQRSQIKIDDTMVKLACTPP